MRRPDSELERDLNERFRQRREEARKRRRRRRSVVLGLAVVAAALVALGGTVIGTRASDDGGSTEAVTTTEQKKPEPLSRTPLPVEVRQGDRLDLPRIRFQFAKHKYGDLRAMIDVLNSFVTN